MHKLHKTSLVAIETVHADRTEWRLSFDGHNPSD